MVLLWIFSFIQILLTSEAYAACGVTNLTWDGSSSTAWNTAANWTPANVPNVATENAIIVAAARTVAVNTVTVGCVDVQSGVLASTNARTITVSGDYFRALNSGTLSVNATHTTFIIRMAGTAAQSVDVVDPVNNITITNNSTVNFTEAFTIRNNLTLSGTTTTLNINENLNMPLTTGTLTIPAGVTVNIAAGKILFMSGDIVVNGTLRLYPGAQIQMDPTKSITVNATGQLRLEGASGNVASIVGNGGYYNLAVAGTLYADYFRFDKVGNDLKGVSITGTLSAFDNGEIHYINNNGYGVTLGAAASVPSTINNLAFFDDANNGTARNFDATLFNVSNIQMEGWAGLGSSKETDPNNRINWGAQAGTVLTLSQNTNVGRPVDPVTAGAVEGEYIIYSFALNQTSLATDITSVKLTLIGSGGSGDIDYVRLYQQGASCQTLGAAIGSTQTMSGSPATTTFTIPPATITVSDTTAVCLHVYVRTTSSATNNNTIGISIESTADVVNSQGYSFSPTSGPPVQSGLATIAGSAISVWDGSSSTVWNTNANWTPATAPTATRSCTIGTGVNNLVFNANRACLNTIFSTGGTVNWNSGAFVLTTFGSLKIQTGVTFQNATLGTITFGGAVNQSMAMSTAFPGNVIINNTGGVTKIISVDSNSTINGNLTVTSGTLLIPAGVTLTVLGNVTVQTGTVLDIQGGGTLKLGNGSSLTVNLGGTLQMIGGASNAIVSSNIGTSAYNVVINGTIKADKYNFDHLNTNGVTINSTATIDPTYNLSNGSFAYPVNNSTTLLRLFKAIPSDTLTNVSFDSSGSTATTITNIYTDATIGAGTLTMNSYSGDLAGASFDNPNTYLINWAGAGNKIVVSQAATSPATVNQGQVAVVMGRFAFAQEDTGVTDTDITALTLTLTGTGAASYVDSVKIYYDSDCDSAAGTLIGTGTFSGSPATVSFSSITGATIQASLLTPPTRCIYVTYDIASNAVNASTLGVRLTQASHMTDSQTYGASNSVIFPVTLGTASTVIGTSTSWTGAVSTAWLTPGNWNGGVPTSSLNCIINSAANNPIISTGTQSCNSITIGTGNLTINVGTTLRIFGAVTNSGTLANAGTLELTDNGVTVSNHTLTLGSTTLSNVSVTNTIGGTISIGGSSATINGLTLNGASPSAYTFLVDTSKTLNLPSGATVNGGTFRVNGGGVVQTGNGQTFTVSGGTLWLNGTSEAYPQSLANKAEMTVQTSGTWGLNSTSGSLNLGGFHLDYLDTNGLVIGGTTTLTALNGGQFTNLSNSYSSVKVVQVNTTGSIPTTASNVGFNWLPNNTTPTSADTYTILSSSGCSNQSMDFTGWFGDWADNVTTFDVTTKVSNTNCNLSLSGMATAVSLLSFKAIPYNSSIDVRWETIRESDHLGFNIFRRLGNGNLVQLNTNLIRNIQSSASLKGKYRFLDETVLNDQRYFYYIQDVDNQGHTKMHGPVSALASSDLGVPPPDADDSNNQDNEDDSRTNNSRDLGDGVIILSQTNKNLRLRINPADPAFTISSWNSNYESVAINGYAKKTQIGSPESLERTILIEVSGNYSEAVVEEIGKSESIINHRLLQPAPSYQLIDQRLVPTYQLNSEIYSLNSFHPNEFYEVQGRLEEISGRKYLKIKINPLLQNPVTSQLKKLEQLTLDFSFDGNGWAQNPSVADSPSPFYNTDNALAISFTASGMHELSFEQMLESDVEGPFNGIDTQQLRLYHLEEEIPIEIISADSVFNAGDKIRFNLEHTPYAEGFTNIAVLTTVNYSNAPALRILPVEGNSTQQADTKKSFEMYQVEVESNLFALLSSPIGEDLDHMYWSQIFAPSVTGPSDSYKNIMVNLEGIASLESENVQLKLFLKGAAGRSLFTRHHLNVFVNNIMAPVGDFILENQEATNITLKIPSNYFFDGNNTIKIKVLGDLVVQDEYDIVYIDKLNINYPRYRRTSSDYLSLKNTIKNRVVKFDGYTSSQINVYDISKYNDTRKVQNVLVQYSNLGFNAIFNTNDEGDFLLGRKYLVLTENRFLRSNQLSLIKGQTTLRSSENRADYIIIADSSIHHTFADFINHKSTQGLETKLVGLDQVFNEFDFGRKSPEAIRNFLNYAHQSWQRPAPRYVLIVGDTSYDPKNYLDFGSVHHKVPGKFVKGQLYDYLSDHWFTTQDSESIHPQFIIGRIPSNNQREIENYLSKVISYELGETSPDLSRSKKVSFFATKSDSLENFEGATQKLNELDVFSIAGISSQMISHQNLSLSQFNQRIIQEFDENNLFLTFNGHGAEDRWARGNGDVHFSNEQASALTNNTYPIVMAMNCLNASFTEADATVVSLAEKLIFNESGGAIAIIGSNSMTTTSAQFHFVSNFFSQLGPINSFADGENLRLGDLFNIAKVSLGESPYMRDVLYSYHLIGDPSLKLPDGTFSQHQPLVSEESEVKAEQSVGTRLFGCTANASVGDEHAQSGLLEFLFFGLILFIVRRFKLG